MSDKLKAIQSCISMGMSAKEAFSFLTSKHGNSFVSRSYVYKIYKLGTTLETTQATQLGKICVLVIGTYSISDV